MNGFDRLREMLDKWLEKHNDDEAFIQTVNYLLDRPELEQKYLNEEKSLDGLNDFIHEKGRQHLLNGWCYITNEVVYSWAVMYFALPNSFLKIKPKETKNENKKNTTKKATSTNNVVSLEEAKQKIEKKKETEQISLFGGAVS